MPIFHSMWVEPGLPSEGATAAASPALPRRLRARHKPFSARGDLSVFRRPFSVSVSLCFETVLLLSFRLELTRSSCWGTRSFRVSVFSCFETVLLLRYRLELTRPRDFPFHDVSLSRVFALLRPGTVLLLRFRLELTRSRDWVTHVYSARTRFVAQFYG